MKNEDLIELGFVTITHFTIGNIVTYKLGRNRELSAQSVGTPNEMLFITSHDDKDSKKITDIICLHNYDYDGYLTIDKVKEYIKLLEYKGKYRIDD